MQWLFRWTFHSRFLRQCWLLRGHHNICRDVVLCRREITWLSRPWHRLLWYMKFLGRADWCGLWAAHRSWQQTFVSTVSKDCTWWGKLNIRISASFATVSISGIALILSGNLTPGKYLPLDLVPSRRRILDILPLRINDLWQLFAIHHFLMHPEIQYRVKQCLMFLKILRRDLCNSRTPTCQPVVLNQQYQFPDPMTATLCFIVDGLCVKWFLIWLSLCIGWATRQRRFVGRPDGSTMLWSTPEFLDRVAVGSATSVYAGWSRYIC